MGNDFSSDQVLQQTSYVAAMASVTALEKPEMLCLRDRLKKAAGKNGSIPNAVSREDFDRAAEEIGVTDSDLEILDRLFILFDKLGDGQVNFRELVVGLSPLAKGNAASKLELAFELYDVDETHQLKPIELNLVLGTINNVASWLGDPVVSQDDVQTIVDDVFKVTNSEANTPASPCNYADAIEQILKHQVAVQFLSGAGNIKLEP